MRSDLDNDFEPAAPTREVKPTIDDVLGALKFSEPVERQTKNGPRMVSDAKANDLVHDLFRDEREEMFTRGYSLGEWPKGSGKWKITKWEKVPEKVVVSRLTTQALSRATDADINAPAPDGLAYLGYQKAGVAFAFEKPATLFGDEPGLGKTIQAIGVLNCSPELKRILVICPASLKLNWRRELEKWLCRKRPILVADSKTFVALADGVVILNYDVLYKHIAILRATEWDCVIADEAHFCKSRDSRRTKCLFGYKPKKKEKDKGVEDEPPLVAKKRMLLTGTPIANRPIELFPLINYLDPFRWNSYWKYAQRYCGASEMNGWDTTGSSHLDELQDILRQSIMVRRLKKDVLKELPAKIRKIVEFPATRDMMHVIAQENEAYHGVDELEAQVELAAASDDPNAYEAAAAKLADGRKAVFQGLSTLRRETAEAKIPLILEHLEEAVEESGKVVCMAHHKSVIAAITAKFGNAAVSLVGDTAMQDRQNAVDRFQKDPSCKLFVGSIMAAGVGITLTAASHVVFAELDWVPGNVSQAEDRCLLRNSLVWCRQSVKSNGMSLVKIQDVKAGDMVLTHTGRLKMVTKTACRNHRGFTTAIEYRGWFEPLRCTHDHKIFVKRKTGDLEWVQAHMLLPSDSMAFPKQKEVARLDVVTIKPEWRLYQTGLKPTHCQHRGCISEIEARGLCRIHYRELLASGVRPPKPEQINSRYVRLPDQIQITDEWLYLFGWYVAEGFASIVPGKSRFVSCSGHRKERHVLNNLVKLFNALGIKCSIYESKVSQGIEMRAYCGELAFWFRDWFGHMAQNKSLPPEIMNLPPDQAAVFLRGYTDGDGYQRKNQVEWVSASKTLCYQICQLAIRSGFIPCMRRIVHPKQKTEHWVGGYTKFPKGKNGNTRLCEQDDNYVYRPISSVTTRHESKEVEVYDLTVEDDHSFTCGLATVHNCHRIGQKDSVLVEHLVLEGSLDATIARRIISKQEVIDKALDVVAEKPVEGSGPPPRPKTNPSDLLAIEADKMTQDQRDASSEAIRFLANRCNGARDWDGAGFSKVDTCIGKDLASRSFLSKKQCALARKIAWKYRGQLPGNLAERIKL